MSKEIRNMINKVKNLNQKINENFNNIKYVKNVDEDRITIIAYINGNKVGSVTSDLLFDAYNYEFDDVFDEDTFDELYPDDTIVKIENLEVDDEYKNRGIGTQLMSHMMALMKKSYNQFYLNASPMGFRGLNVSNLVNFYEKFGFKELLNQGGNVLMGVIF